MADEHPAARVTSPSSSPGYQPRVVIVGSGFGGSVVALRLSESGRFHVTLLERGHRYESGDFPRLRIPDTITSNPEWAYNGRLPDATRFVWRVDRGLWDLRNLGGLQTLQAAGLGGGSLVYAGVHYRAPDVVFRTWPRHKCQHAGCTACTQEPVDSVLLSDYYARVEKALGVSHSTKTWPKTVAFEAAAQRLGRRATSVPLAIHFEGPPPEGKPADSRPCTGCGQCITGCNDGGKNTLDRTYLARAERAGLRIRTLCEVSSLQALSGDPRESSPCPRYRVHFRDHFAGGKSGHLDADYVFVCAGAVSTTELLRHSVFCGHLQHCEGLTQIGKRFWANGDAFAAAFNTRDVWSSEQGPTITRSVGHVEPKSDASQPGATLTEVTAEDNDANPDWFLLQNGGLPPNLVPVLSLLTSPALLARNAYAADSQDPATDDSPRWDWLSKAARLNSTPNVAGVLSAFPPDMHVLLPKQASYRAAILAFLDAQLCLVRRELGAGPQFSLASSVRRLLLNFFGANTKFVEELRLALGKHSVMGVLFDAPHSVALAAHAIERYLLGPRPNAHTAIFLAMGADAEWSLTYSPRAKHRLYARTKDKERVHRLYRVEERLMRDFAKAAGGQLRTNPGFSVGQRPITVHAQGGCSMGNDVEDSVVDATGEVWGHPGLFVMDGAMLPSSVGVNPSHTIAAVAELNIAHFLERTRTVSLDQEGRPPPPYVYAIDYGRGPESNSAFEAPRTSSAPVAVPPSVDDVGKPVVEYVPIATSPTSLTWEERMVGFLKQTSGLGKQQHTLHREGRLEPDGYLEHYNAGVFAGYALDLVLKARISDLDVFLSHREPVIDIEGSAQLRIPSTTPHLRSYAVRGTLTLRFDVGELPDAPPRSTRPSGGVVVSITPTMHYDLELEPSLDALVSERENGLAPRHLWGTKLLVDDPGIDAWQDLTTLYTDLADETFGVCLSGIVRVSLQEFLNRQLRSFAVDKEKTTGLSDAQKAMALGRFLKRFFGDLAQLYDVGGTI